MTLRKYRSDRNVPEVTAAPVHVRFFGHIVEKKDDLKTVIAQVEIPGMPGVQQTEITLLRAKHAAVRENDTVVGSAFVTKFYSENVNGLITSIAPKNVVIRNARGAQIA